MGHSPTEHDGPAAGSTTAPSTPGLRWSSQAAGTALLLENVHDVAEHVLAAEGMTVRRASGAMDEDELIDALQDVDLLGIRSKTQVTAAVLENAPHLMAIGAFCIGTNQIDLGAAADAGVAVFNAPFSNTRSVVELAVAELISLTRRLTDKNAALHADVWDKSAQGAHEVRGRRLGIVGYGNIGSQLSVVAEALGMTVSFYDIADKLAVGNAQRRSSLQDLLEDADVVSLHVDGRPGNAGIFGDEQFSQMKPGAILLNLSRGFVADHASPAQAHRERPPRRRRDRRLPGRAEAPGRPLRLSAAGPSQRDPDAPCGRLHRGGPGGHRPVHRGEAQHLCAHRRHDACR